MQAAADEISEAVGNDARVTSTGLELGKDFEACGGVGIKNCAGEAFDAVGSWEAEELFDVGSLERIDP